jgi:Asp-tRNA(Asn)/Glu-tRNA(Gln) amidotransferase C subunit
MHEFVIAKEAEDDNKTIIGLRGRSDEDTNWVMRKTCVRAKPNSQVSEWSPKLWLLHSVPEKDSMPKGTPKFHLFRKLTRENKLIEQSPEELEKKLNQLKDTVKTVSRMNQFDEEDQKWWDDFWSVRSRTRARLGTDAEDCEPDELSVTLVKDLLWSVKTPAANQVQTRQAATEDLEVNPMRDLAIALTPRTRPAGTDEFGRSRKIGYVRVGADETEEEVLRASQRNKNAGSEEKRLEFFRSLQVSRGKGPQGEYDFAKKQFKVRVY